MTSKVINLGVLVFLLIPVIRSVQRKSFDINNTSSTKYPIYSSHILEDHELSSDKDGTAVSTRSKEKPNEEKYNQRGIGLGQIEENKTPSLSDNLWIFEDKTKGMAKEEKINYKNISSSRLLFSNAISDGALSSHRANKDLRATFENKRGRSRRYVHSRFTKVGDRDTKYPSYMPPGQGTNWAQIEQGDSYRALNNNMPPEFVNHTLERLIKEVLMRQKALDVITKMEQYNTAWRMKFQLAIMFLIMGFMIALFAGPKIMKFRFRRIDPDDEKTLGNMEAERCKYSKKNKKRVACFDTFLEKLRAHYRRKSESNSKLGDKASQKTLNVELNRNQSENKPLLTEVRHIQPPLKSHAETPLCRGSSSSNTYFTVKEVPSVDQSGVAPCGSRGKFVSSRISESTSDNILSSASSRSRETVTSITKNPACPQKVLSTCSFKESGHPLLSVVPIMKQINITASESKYPIPSEIRCQTPCEIKGPFLCENQASSASRRNDLVVSSINNTDDSLKGRVMTDPNSINKTDDPLKGWVMTDPNSINKTDDPLKGRVMTDPNSINKTDDSLKGWVMTDPNSQMAHGSGSEETLYEQPTKFNLGKLDGSGGKRVYFHIKSQKKKKTKSKDTK